MKSNGILEAIVVFVIVSAFIAVVGLALAWPFQLMWNYAVVAAISVAQPIGFWHSFWLVWLLGLFVRGGSSNSSK